MIRNAVGCCSNFSIKSGKDPGNDWPSRLPTVNIKEKRNRLKQNGAGGK